MVLVHKLRQSEQVDLTNIYVQYEPKPVQISPTRPQTRSQSNDNRVDVKRRRILNEEPVLVKKPRKQQQTRTRKPKSVSSEDDADADADSDEEEYIEPIPSPQVKLVQVDPSVQSDPPTHRAGPRTRVQPPIPVPNLTKKSRGRRVPTTNSINSDDGDVRRYVCSVESCGKCFYRGEHLKRHVRSIHTNEKPFDCPHPKCNKTFNRHDNLLQHVKIHGQRAVAAATANRKKTTATSSASSLASTASSTITVSDAPAPSSPPLARTDTLVDLDATSNEDTRPSVSPSITALHEQVQQQHYMMMMAAAAASTSPYTLEPPTPAYVANNMAAVSSLRTEIAGGSTAGSEGGDVEVLDHTHVDLSRIPEEVPEEVPELGYPITIQQHILPTSSLSIDPMQIQHHS